MAVLKSTEQDVLADHTERLLESTTVQYRRLLAALESDSKPTAAAALAREVSTLLSTVWIIQRTNTLTGSRRPGAQSGR